MGEGTQGLGHGYEIREVKGHGWLGTFQEEGRVSFLTLRERTRIATHRPSLPSLKPDVKTLLLGQ